MKFGSSVLRDPGHVGPVAREVKRVVQRGLMPVVVVSAMGDQTDYLLDLAAKVSPNPGRACKRELDMLLTAGERISMSLVAMALNELGVKARSYTGSQVGIITDTNFGRARIKQIRLFRISEDMDKGTVPVVAGFQGISTEKEVTTLGRGGSDLTAVALAASLGPDVGVSFYKDVSRVYSLNPKRFPGAKPVRSLDYDEALEMSFFGSEVVHYRALALAARAGVKLEVRALDKGATRIGDDALEAPGLKAVVSCSAVVLVLRDVPQHHKFEHQVITQLARAGVRVLSFSHGPEPDSLVFVLDSAEGHKAERVLKSLSDGFSVQTITGKALVSLVGHGVGSDPGMYQQAVASFAETKTHIDAMTSSDLRLSFVIDQKDVPAVEENLAKRFDLVNGQGS